MSRRIGENDSDARTTRSARFDLLGRWARLALCLLVLWGFVFQVAPRLQRLDVVRALHDVVREKDIDATALYYTEIDEFNDTASYMRDAMRY